MFFRFEATFKQLYRMSHSTPYLKVLLSQFVVFADQVGDPQLSVADAFAFVLLVVYRPLQCSLEVVDGNGESFQKSV